MVTGSGTDPESIRNPHMRAHAREGQLFPRALAAAAKLLRIPALTIVEADAFTKGATALSKTPDALKDEVTELGRAVGKPWGSEEKTAAAAFTKGATALSKTPDALKDEVTELGRAVGKPWGSEEKTAAAAAWLALVS